MVLASSPPSLQISGAKASLLSIYGWQWWPAEVAGGKVRGTYDLRLLSLTSFHPSPAGRSGWEGVAGMLGPRPVLKMSLPAPGLQKRRLCKPVFACLHVPTSATLPSSASVAG